MACSEERVIAFLAGELAAPEEEAFDAHLLACEECWLAVQEDRSGRAALELLREGAPAGLAERISFSVEIAATEAGARMSERGRFGRLRATRRGRARLVVRCAAALIVLAGAVAAVGVGLASSGPSDPPVVAALVSMAESDALTTAVPSRAHEMALGGQHVVVRAYRLEGSTTIVAVSEHPFAMPPASHVAGSSDQVWMATRDGIGLYCVNAPDGKHSMLAAGTMAAVALPNVLARLGLPTA